MKCLFIATDVGLDKGGIQTFAYYIIKLFNKENVDFDTFIINQKKNIENLKRMFYSNREYKTILLMDIYKIKYIPVTIILNLFKIQKNRIAVIIHGDEIISLSFLKKLIIAILLRTINFILIANSNETAKIFYENFHKDCHFINYPFTDCQSNAVKNNQYKNKNEYVIFTLSRLVKRKNIASAIIAVSELIKKNYNIKYYIAGIGPEFDNLKNLINKLNMNNNIILLGRISEEEKVEYFSHCNLFVLPSLYLKGDSIEGFGIVFIEANKFGIPIISGNTGGMKEAVLENITGFHSDGTVNDIKEKIEKAIKFPFDKEKIKEHGMKFDYRNQIHFLKIVMGS